MKLLKQGMRMLQQQQQTLNQMMELVFGIIPLICIQPGSFASVAVRLNTWAYLILILSKFPIIAQAKPSYLSEMKNFPLQYSMILFIPADQQ